MGKEGLGDNVELTVVIGWAVVKGWLNEPGGGEGGTTKVVYGGSPMAEGMARS